MFHHIVRSEAGELKPFGKKTVLVDINSRSVHLKNAKLNGMKKSNLCLLQQFSLLYMFRDFKVEKKKKKLAFFIVIFITRIIADDCIYKLAFFWAFCSKNLRKLVLLILGEYPEQMSKQIGSKSASIQCSGISSRRSGSRLRALPWIFSLSYTRGGILFGNNLLLDDGNENDVKSAWVHN